MGQPASAPLPLRQVTPPPRLPRYVFVLVHSITSTGVASAQAFGGGNHSAIGGYGPAIKRSRRANWLAYLSHLKENLPPTPIRLYKPIIAVSSGAFIIINYLYFLFGYIQRLYIG